MQGSGDSQQEFGKREVFNKSSRKLSGVVLVKLVEKALVVLG